MAGASRISYKSNQYYDNKRNRYTNKFFPECQSEGFNLHTSSGSPSILAYKSRSTDSPTLRKPQNAAFNSGFSPFYPNSFVSFIRSRHPAEPNVVHNSMITSLGPQRVTQLYYWHSW